MRKKFQPMRLPNISNRRRIQVYQSNSPQSEEQIIRHNSRIKRIKSTKSFDSRRRSSVVWDYMKSTQNQSQQYIQCLQPNCSFRAINQHGNTNKLRKHLQTVHHINLQAKKLSKNVTGGKSGTQSFITQLCCRNLLSYHQVVKIGQLQRQYNKSTLIPNSTRALSLMVKKNYKQKKQLYRKELLTSDFKDDIFCLSIGSCTYQSRRFMSVFLYQNRRDTIFLTLIRLKENSTSVYLKGIIQKQLQYFGISNNQIFAITSDSSSNNLRLSIDFNCYQQHCILHILDSCVTKSLFQQSKLLKKQYFEEDINISDFQEAESPMFVEEQNIFAYIDFEDIGNIVSIQKVRQSIKFIKCSGVGSDYFKKIDNVALTLDIQTKWLSTYQMLIRFIQVNKAVNQILIKYQNATLILLESQRQQIQHIVSVLQQVKIARQNIQNAICNILRAQQFIDTLCMVLGEISQNILAKKLRQIIISQYSKYRNVELVCAGLYLENSTGYLNYIKRSSFKCLKVSQIQEFIQEKFQIIQSKLQYISKSQQEKITNSIYNSIYESLYPCNKQISQPLSQQLMNYRNENLKGKMLTRILNKIQTIIAHSAFNQKSYSLLGNAVGNSRCRLSDESIGAINFLNWYYGKRQVKP